MVFWSRICYYILVRNERYEPCKSTLSSARADSTTVRTREQKEERRGKKMEKKEIEKVTTESTEMYTAEECKRYANFDARVNNALKMADRSMIELGGALAVIKNEHLYKVDGYKSIGAYATERFGISKATVSDSINTFIEFGDVATGELRDEFLDYTFSQLKLMRRLPESMRLDVTPDTTSREIQKMINDYNTALEDHAKEEIENTTEEEAAETIEPKSENVVHVENTGETEPHITLMYSVSEYVDMDAETLKRIIVDSIKKGMKVILDYKFD